MEEKNIKKHPSYGLIHLVRRDNNAGSTLFGCDVKQHRTIQLEIRKGYKYTDYGLPHYTTEGNKPILEVEMSFAQFSDLIINQNFNFGVPCTIKSINGVRIEDPPEDIDVVNDFYKDFQDNNKDLVNSISQLQKELDEYKNNGKKISKSKLEEMRNRLSSIKYSLNSNLSYQEELFRELMSGIVDQKKNELASYISDKAGVLDNDKLKDLLNICDDNTKLLSMDDYDIDEE